jgi:hypothetical protein
VKHFGTKDTVLAVNRYGPEQGMALVQQRSAGIWSTFQPSQSPLGLILFSNCDGHEGLFELMKSLPGYVFLFSVLQQDPLNTAFSKLSAQSNIEILKYIDIPRLAIAGDFQAYWAKRSKNLRHNLDRQIRRIQESGKTLELVVERRPSRMAECVREYGRLESIGWKAQHGTAVNENNIQGQFYRDICEHFSAAGEAIVFQLLLDGKAVASDLCLFRNGMLVVLKTTYDEKVEKLSPALLMRREIVRELHAAAQVRMVEFYGRVVDWHTQWMTDTRTMFHVNVFRNIYLLKTRRILKRFR